MHAAMLLGSAVGAVIGAMHAIGLMRRIAARADHAFPALPPGKLWTPLYYGLWTVLLWTVFGAYVLYAWILACAIHALHRWRSRRPLPGRDGTPPTGS
jgi:predicted lysophospholipase L1 biosynthesis ABC-type transport system permease subunit